MSTIKVNKILSANNPVVDVADGLTVTGEVKVGSAVTSNSTGIDITGIATATNVSVGSSVTASTFHGSGANLTSIPAAQLTGTVADARISSSSVTQHVTAFDDDKIINDISALALKVSALENSTASNTNSTFVDTYQDSAGISTITTAGRDTAGEFISTIFDTVTTYQFDQAGTHGQPGMLRLNSSMGTPVTGYWAEERVAEASTSNHYNNTTVNFAFDLSADFTHYIYHRVNSSGQATSIAFPASGALISPHTTITSGKNPTYNGSTIWDIDLAANQAGTESGKGSYRLDQCINGLFTSAVETHLGTASIAGGVGPYNATAVNKDYSTDANAHGLYYAKYMNTGSARHGVKYTYTKSNNTLIAQFITNDAGATTNDDGKATITNLPTTGRVFLFYGNANGGSSTSQFIGMKTDASGVGVSSGSFLTSTVSAAGSYQSVTINAASTTSKIGVVITYVDHAGTATLNTDLKVFLSANNGTNYTQVTLVAQPNFATGIKMAKANDVTISNTGTQLKYKVEFANQASGSKVTRVTGVSLQY